MIPDTGVLVSAIAFLTALFCMWSIRQDRARRAGELQEVREECERRGSELKSALALAEENMQNTEELLRDGRLSRSARAKALQMLRAGTAPETVAEQMGMATREMRLLARVSELLCR